LTQPTELDSAVAEIVFLGTNARVPFSDLANKTQASMQEIRQSIQRLDTLGYPFNLKSGSVERLPTHMIHARELEASLRSRKIGRRIEWKLHVASTQDELKKIRHEAQDGTVLLAETQGSGRGRLGRRWFSPLGGIWMSVLLRPRWSESHQILPLTLGAGLARAVSEVTGIATSLKWPNDIVTHSGKIAGLLAEAAFEGAVLRSLIVGFGVNANISPALLPSELWQGVTSLSRELGHETDRDLLVRRMLEEMDSRYLMFESGHHGKLLNEVRGLCSTIAREVEVRTSERTYKGLVQDIGDAGELLLRLRNGETVPFYAADVMHVR